MKKETIPCQTCQQPFERDAECSLGPEHLTTDCDPCMEAAWIRHQEAIAEKSREKSRQRGIEAFKDICPPRIYESNPDHPEFKKSLHAKATAWNPTEERPWMGIVGKKGSCKSRIAIMRTKDQMASLSPARQPLFVAAYDFAEAVQYRFDDETGESRQLIQNCRNSDWLILDDIGKARATPAVVAALFALLDHRHSHNLVTIWTSNSTPEEFCEGMPADTAGPMVRRLKESSTLFSIA